MHNVVQFFDTRRPSGQLLSEWVIPGGRELRNLDEIRQNPPVRYLEYNSKGDELLIQRPVMTSSFVVSIDSAAHAFSPIMEIPTVTPFSNQMDTINRLVEAYGRDSVSVAQKLHIALPEYTDEASIMSMTSGSSSGDSSGSSSDSSNDEDGNHRRLNGKWRNLRRSIIFPGRTYSTRSIEFSTGACFRKDGQIISIGSKGNIYIIGSSPREKFSLPDEDHDIKHIPQPEVVEAFSRRPELKRIFSVENPIWTQYKERLSMGLEPPAGIHLSQKLISQISIERVDQTIGKLFRLFSKHRFPHMMNGKLSDEVKFFILCCSRIVCHLPTCSKHRGADKSFPGSHVWNACVSVCGFRIPTFRPAEPAGTIFVTTVREIQIAYAEAYGGLIPSFEIASYLSQLVHRDKRETVKNFPHIKIGFYRGDTIDMGIRQPGKLKGLESATAAVTVTVIHSRFGYSLKNKRRKRNVVMSQTPISIADDDTIPAPVVVKEVSSSSSDDDSNGLFGPPSAKRARTPPPPLLEGGRSSTMMERKAVLVVKQLVHVKDVLSNRLITMDMIDELRTRWSVPKVNLTRPRKTRPGEPEKWKERNAARRAARDAARMTDHEPVNAETDAEIPSSVTSSVTSPSPTTSESSQIPLSQLLRGRPN